MSGMHVLFDPARFAVDIARMINGAVRAPRLNAGRGFLLGYISFTSPCNPSFIEYSLDSVSSVALRRLPGSPAIWLFGSTRVRPLKARPINPAHALGTGCRDKNESEPVRHRSHRAGAAIGFFCSSASAASTASRSAAPAHHEGFRRDHALGDEESVWHRGVPA